jgi:hypothetical protein
VEWNFIKILYGKKDFDIYIKKICGAFWPSGQIFVTPHLQDRGSQRSKILVVTVSHMAQQLDILNLF